MDKQSNPKALQDAIESVRKSSWQNKNEMIKALEEQLEESRIEKSYEPSSSVEKDYATARGLITKATMPAAQKEAQLNALDDIYAPLLEKDEVRKAQLADIIKSEGAIRVLNTVTKSYQAGIISADDAHQMMSDAIDTDKRLTSE